jgi:hypothetical protein
MTVNYPSSLEYWEGGGRAGYRITWFREADDKVAYWYVDDIREAMQIVLRARPPRGTRWVNVTP